MKDDIRTQFDMDDIDELGFVKIDLLGLRTLSTLMESLRLIKRNNNGELPFKHFYEWNFEWEKYYEDPAVWDSICTGNNIGCFQIETNDFRSLSKRFLPRSIEDLCAMIAIFRPGITRSVDSETGLNLLEMYLQKREGKRPVTYKHPNLEKILGVSYGSFVYQEQIMEACVALAGYTIPETDRVRKAVAKSHYEDMVEECDVFVRKCEEQGVDRETALSIFDDMRAFGMYGFNKSHGYGYSMLAYWTAWVKYYYPREFMTALFITNPDGNVTYTRESRRMGIEVMGPDINESGGNFTLTTNGNIRYGLNSVKNISKSADYIQKMGPFASVQDFAERIPAKIVNKKAILSLIKCGVFDSIAGDTKTALRQFVENRKEFKKELKHPDDLCPSECEHCAGSLTMFDCYAINVEKIEDRGMHERELLGAMVTVDPLAGYIGLIEEEQNFPGEHKMYRGEKAMIGGIISKIETMVTKRGKNVGSKMCQVWIELPIKNFEDDQDDEVMDEMEDASLSDESVKLVVFPQVYAKIQSELEVGSPVLVKIEKLYDGLSLKNVYRLDKLSQQ